MLETHIRGSSSDIPQTFEFRPNEANSSRFAEVSRLKKRKE